MTGRRRTRDSGGRTPAFRDPGGRTPESPDSGRRDSGGRGADRRGAAGAAGRPPARPRVDPALYRRDWAFALWHVLVSMGAAFVPQLPVQDDTFEPLDWPEDWFDEWFAPYHGPDSGWGEDGR